MSKKYDLNLILVKLENAYQAALLNFHNETSIALKLPSSLKNLCDSTHLKGIRATAAFNNLITGLSIKNTFPNLDVRYHQTGIQDQSHLGESWFNHRGISENLIYPWLSSHHFVGAKSGWQTRTLERPKPYILSYDENISIIKKEFLEFYDIFETVSLGELNSLLIYLLELQIKYRDKQNITLATPNISNINRITNHIKDHIFFDYLGKGASRLPVLALYAILQLVEKQITRYASWTLLPLESHSAADSQTNSSGDIEFIDSDRKLIEAIEVKHNIVVDENLVNEIILKVSSFQLDRFYIHTYYSLKL